jgi:hypothetical protein
LGGIRTQTLRQLTLASTQIFPNQNPQKILETFQKKPSKSFSSKFQNTHNQAKKANELQNSLQKVLQKTDATFH